MPKAGTSLTKKPPKCVACDGKGQSSRGGECRPCLGTGYKLPTCKTCCGTSRTKDNRPCPTCHGQGVIK